MWRQADNLDKRITGYEITKLYLVRLINSVNNNARNLNLKIRFSDDSDGS